MVVQDCFMQKTAEFYTLVAFDRFHSAEGSTFTTRTCGADGMWTGLLPDVVKIACPLSELEEGAYCACRGLGAWGANCNATCATDADDSLRCRQSQSW